MPHWVSQYDGIADLTALDSRWRGFNIVGKQWSGGPDRSVFLRDYTSAQPAIPPSPPLASDEPSNSGKLDGLITTISYLGGNVGDEVEGIAAWLRATAHKLNVAADTLEYSSGELHRVRAQMVGARH